MRCWIGQQCRILWQKVLTPAAKRKSVAHLQSCHGMGERRACRVINAVARACVTVLSGTMTVCVRSRASWPTNVPVRLSPSTHCAAPRGDLDQPQKDPEALLEGRLGGQASRRRRAPAPVLAMPNWRWSLELGALLLPFSAPLQIRARPDGLRQAVPGA